MSLDHFRQKSPKADYILAIAVFALVVFGIIMISSSSVVIAYERYGDNLYYVKKQLLSLILGIIAWVVASQIDYRFWKKYALPMLILTLFLLIGVFIPGLGQNYGGAHRWIDLGIVSFQPSEIIKLTFIIYLAAWLEKRQENLRDFKSGFIPFAAVLGLIILLVMKQPDMGTMSVIVGSAVIIFFLSGAPVTHFILGGAGLASLFFLYVRSAPYRWQRFAVFLNPSSETLGASYHINQALLAIGSGGLFGLGFGQSRQKYLYLPAAHTDSIFAITVEELGFLRSSLIIAAFVFLAIRGYRIAKNAPDQFSRLLAGGITSWFVVQAFINLGAMMGVIPLTGIPLPFLSYGGTSLVISLFAIGVLMNISKSANLVLNNAKN